MKLIKAGEPLPVSGEPTAQLSEEKIQELQTQFPEWIVARCPDGSVYVSAL